MGVMAYHGCWRADSADVVLEVEDEDEAALASAAALRARMSKKDILGEILLDSIDSLVVVFGEMESLDAKETRMTRRETIYG